MSVGIKNMLKNKGVLYATVVVFLVNIVALMVSKNFVSVILFCLTSLVINYYNKNMIIVLIGSLLVTDLYVLISSMFSKKEGMTQKTVNKTQPEIDATDTTKLENTAPPSSNNTEKCVGANCKKTKTGAGSGQSKINPAAVEGEDEEDEGYAEDTKIDYASTLENAYSNLDKLLNSDAINSMTNDTHRLAEKQKALMGNINKLEPMMQKAGSLLEGLDMSNMDDMLSKLTGKLGGMAKKK